MESGYPYPRDPSPEDTLVRGVDDIDRPVETAAPAPAVDWRDALPLELRDDPTLRDVRDVAGLAKGYIHAQRLVGADRIPVPGRNADPEAWAMVFDRLGRPRSPDGYSLERPAEMELPYDEGLESAFRERAHALGLLPEQAAGLYAWWLDLNRDDVAQQRRMVESRRDGAREALRAEWAHRFDDRLRRANDALRRFADDELRERVAEGLGDDPAFIRFCARIGDLVGEHRLEGPGAGAGFSSAVDAKRRIAEVFADRGHPYFQRDDPRHAHAVEEVRRLFESAYG
ncbi:MAG: hypothetical protein IPK81_15815 [Rhodospirillales bacterium]|nr:MAG: hypothetical protein IPK81_15815 [Rhodospirillales bacterium]